MQQLLRYFFIGYAILLAASLQTGFSQNIGIGTTNPQSQLHVNGDFRLKNGVPVTTISADSMFTNASDTALPTQKAMQRYLQKGVWAPQSGSLQSSILFRDFIFTNLDGPQSVFVQGNYAYVASWRNSRLCIYDISNPDNILAKATSGQDLFSPFAVFVQGNFAYVASTNNNRLCSYDVTNPDAIRFAGSTNVNLVSLPSFPPDNCCSYKNRHPLRTSGKKLTCTLAAA